MSRQLHVGNQQFFRQYAPDSELPLENRIFTTEYEQARRQRGDAAQPADFVSPMDFNISMNNEMYFLRSLHLRLPVTAKFYDEFGNCVRSPEEVACLAIRNRADRCFQKIEANLNSDEVPIDPQRMCREVRDWIETLDDPIVIGDGGDIVATAAKILPVKGEGAWMDPGPLGTLGVGMPFGLAAQLSHPEKRGVIIYGDGSFGLNGFEFDPAVRF